MEIVLAVAVTFVLAFFLGRGSIKLTYAGEIIEERPEDGRLRFSLDVSTPLDDLRKKKSVIFKVVPFQDTLL